MQAASIQSIATTAAIVLGGVWTYFKFIKDRIYRPRADLSLEGVRHRVSNQINLACLVTVKNIGASKITLIHVGMGVRISEAKPMLAPLEEPEWVRLRTLPIFEQHSWIESGETIRDEAIVGLPSHDDSLLQVEARLVFRRALRKNVTVYSRVLVFPEEEERS